MSITDDQSGKLVQECQEGFRIPSKLIQEAQQRDIVPPWVMHAADQRRDWLASFHQNFTERGWPEAIQRAGAGLLERAGNLGMAVMSETARAVVMPVSAPAYLRSLLEIIGYPMVPPGSSDPQAKMLLDGNRMAEAARQLGCLLGMLEETGYLESTSEAFGGAVTAGVRFLYYHELGHLIDDLTESNGPPAWIVPGEEELVKELVADQFAFGALAMELRRHPELQPVGFSGIALALGLVALKECSEQEYEGDKRNIKNATLRMSRQLY